MPSFWSDLLRTLRRSAPLLFLFVTLQSLIAIQFETSYTLLAYLLILPLSYHLFRAALFDQGLPGFAQPTSTGPRPPPRAFMRYMLVSLPVTVLAVAVSSLVDIVTPWALLTTFDFLILEVMTLWFGAWIVLLAFGHLLPAAAAGKPFEPKTALRVGWQTAARTALPLLILPPITFWSVLRIFERIGEAIRDADIPQVARLGAIFALLALLLLSFVIMVVILARAYRHIWPDGPRTAEVFD